MAERQALVYDATVRTGIVVVMGPGVPSPLPVQEAVR